LFDLVNVEEEDEVVSMRGDFSIFSFCLFVLLLLLLVLLLELFSFEI
jgi:hypothetical protein